MTEGYVRIGTASYKTNGDVHWEDLQNEGRKVGADVVLCSMTKFSSKIYLPPLLADDRGTSFQPADYVHVSGSVTLFGGNYGGTSSVGGGMMDFKGQVTSSGVPGLSPEEMTFIDAQSFDSTISFWRRKVE